MSETQNNEAPIDFKKFSEDFSKKLESITGNITELGRKVEEKTSALESKVEGLNKKETKDDYETEFSNYDREEVEKVEKTVDKKFTQFEQKLEKERQYERDCQYWDGEASKDYPQIRIPEVRAKVLEELGKMKVIGKTKKGENLYEPDAVYNAAARVVGRLAASGQLQAPPPEPLEFGGYEPKIKGKGITEVQQAICEKLGIKPERAKEIYKDFTPRRRN